MAAARKRPEIGTISTTFLPSVPQQFVNVDRDKVLKQGVALTDVYRTIQAYMGGAVRQLLQQFRPHLAGVCGSRSAFPVDYDESRSVLRPQQPGRAGAALGAGKIRDPLRPRVHDALQRVPVRADQRQPRRRATARTRRRRPWKKSSSKPCPAKWASTTWACPIRSRRHGKAFPPG